MSSIEGVEIEIDEEAVVVTAAAPLTVLSSAVDGGGLGPARTIVNLHVHKHCPWEDVALRLDAFVARRCLPAPRVGLLTAASTAQAQVASERAADIDALVVVTVGLGNLIAAGWSAAAAAPMGTINTIVVLDANPEPAALVNLALTVTEVKSLVLGEAGLHCANGRPASGTSTDAVVIAATGRGRPVRFGGPISEAGWLVARVARRALGDGVRCWIEEHR
jgi:adenosylcobinamide amidohydrolase